MIRTRLAELLAERSLKISRISKDTGVARSTLTSLAQNETKMIQLETVNTLCNYLGTTPGDLFEYIPIDFKITVEMTLAEIITEYASKDIEEINLNFDCYIDYLPKETSQKLTFSLTGKGQMRDGQELLVEVNFDKEEEEKTFLKLKNELPPGLKGKFVQSLIDEILLSANIELHQKYVFFEEAGFIDNIDEALNPGKVVFTSESTLFKWF